MVLLEQVEELMLLLEHVGELVIQLKVPKRQVVLSNPISSKPAFSALRSLHYNLTLVSGFLSGLCSFFEDWSEHGHRV